MPKTTEKPRELEGTPTTEALADDVAAESATFAPGTPEFVPHLKMRRMRRAEAYGALGRVQAQNEKANPKKADSDSDEQGEDDPAASNAPVEIDPLEYGERYKILGLIEEYLEICAVDKVEFDKWVLEVDDSVLIKTFNTYMKVNQPGEATSSAS